VADSRFAQFASSDPAGPDTGFWNQRVYFDGIPRRRREIVPTLAATPYMTEKAARLFLATAAVADGTPPLSPPAGWFADGSLAVFGFNPDQPRAANGKFGAGGVERGSSVAGVRKGHALEDMRRISAENAEKAAKKKPVNPYYGRDIKVEEKAKSDKAKNDPRNADLKKQYEKMMDEPKDGAAKTDKKAGDSKPTAKPEVGEGAGKHAVVAHLFAAMGKNKELVKPPEERRA
jgi:hypothetical protein